VNDLERAQARLQKAQQEMAGGPVVDAQQKNVVEIARALSGYLGSQAGNIAAWNIPQVNDTARKALTAIARDPTSLADSTVASNVHTFAGALQGSADLGELVSRGGQVAREMISLAKLSKAAGLVNGAAGALAHAQDVLGPEGGNAGDAVAIAGNLMVALGALEASSPLGWAGVGLDVVGSWISGAIHDSASREAARASMIRDGMPASVADTLVNAEPEILKGLYEHGVSNERVVELAARYPALLTNPTFGRELVELMSHATNGLSPQQMQILQRWDSFLKNQPP